MKDSTKLFILLFISTCVSTLFFTSWAQQNRLGKYYFFGTEWNHTTELLGEWVSMPVGSVLTGLTALVLIGCVVTSWQEEQKKKPDALRDEILRRRALK